MVRTRELYPALVNPSRDATCPITCASTHRSGRIDQTDFHAGTSGDDVDIKVVGEWPVAECTLGERAVVSMFSVMSALGCYAWGRRSAPDTMPVPYENAMVCRSIHELDIAKLR